MIPNRLLMGLTIMLLLPAGSACVAEQKQNTAGVDSTSDSIPAGHSPTIDQRILFEFTFINFAWGFQCYGFYVDSGGDVWKYRYGENDDPWQPDDTQNLTEVQLLGKYSRNPALVATLDRETVHHMAALIPAASEGELSDRRNVGNDIGSMMYLAYTFDADEDTYHPVTLMIDGDWVTENYAAEAKSLVQWLRSIKINWEH